MAAKKKHEDEAEVTEPTFKGEVKFNHKGTNLDGTLLLEEPKTEAQVFAQLREWYPTRDADQFEIVQ